MPLTYKHKKLPVTRFIAVVQHACPSLSLCTQARGVVRTVKKQRRLQRIRNDKFTEYFQSRALGSDRGGGHGYLGINYSHDKDE